MQENAAPQQLNNPPIFRHEACNGHSAMAARNPYQNGIMLPCQPIIDDEPNVRGEPGSPDQEQRPAWRNIVTNASITIIFH
jgi:hypothetical protein